MGVQTVITRGCRHGSCKLDKNTRHIWGNNMGDKDWVTIQGADQETRQNAK